MLNEQIITDILRRIEGNSVTLYNDMGMTIEFDPESVDDINDDPLGAIFSLTGIGEDDEEYVVTIILDPIKEKIVDYFDIDKS